jgi:hypothetical protein
VLGSGLCYIWNMSKKCTKCFVVRDSSEYRKAPANKDGLQSRCKYCQNIEKEEWRKKNLDKVNKHAKEFYKRDPERAKGRSIQKFFKGLSWLQSYDKYQSMLLEQNHTCAICKTHDSKKSLAIDHCHKTGKVRGLLCHSCNVTLGRMKESVIYLESAIAYLKKHSA